jgi:hypothetical protein
LAGVPWPLVFFIAAAATVRFVAETVFPRVPASRRLCDWPPSDRRTEAIRASAVKPLDWFRLLRVAKRHQVTGLVHEGLTRAHPNVPPEVACELNRQAAALVRNTIGRTETLLYRRGNFNGNPHA